MNKGLSDMTILILVEEGMGRGGKIDHANCVWVTRPERPKGTKDEVKQARRALSAQNRP